MVFFYDKQSKVLTNSIVKDHAINCDAVNTSASWRNNSAREVGTYTIKNF